MGKTRDPFKKIRDTKGTFKAKMGKIKDRNGIDLKEAEDIKKRWQGYFQQPLVLAPKGRIKAAVFKNSQLDLSWVDAHTNPCLL